MSIVRINAITVPDERREAFEERFAARAGEVSGMEGFEEFQLLRPSEGQDKYLVYTRWESQEAFDAWVNSDAFRRGHAGHNPQQAPVASHSELWGFEVIQREGPATG
ncbi:MAG: antibiotic biosynthesis monooxygenase [Miltoncostaeaceae bacterium]